MSSLTVSGGAMFSVYNRLMRSLTVAPRLAFCAALAAMDLLPLPPQTGGPAFRQDEVVAVAHRGLSPGLPENTLPAFRASIARGVHVIELDLRGTADGEVVVMHDATVDRTTNGTGEVARMTLAQLKTLEAGSYVDARFAGERIPTYEEVLSLVKGTRTRLLLDIKLSPSLDKARVIRLTERHGAAHDVIVGVRSVADLREFRALSPAIRTLAFVPDVESVESFVAAGADIVRLWPAWIFADRGLVARVRAMGTPVWTTAGELPRASLEKLIAAGVNGILTDLPDVLLPLLADIEKRR